MYPAFTSTIPANEERPRVAAFVAKNSIINIIYTPRLDILADPDQILNITASGLQNTVIFNVYNEKSQHHSDQNTVNQYTVERKLMHLALPSRAIVCGDFNAHHPWWNSRIGNPVRADNLVT